MAGSPEIHGHDTSQYELAMVTRRLGGVFELRVQIATKRYLVNVLNQFFSQLTLFLFFSIGGYLAIMGDITIGSLVAVLAAYKDMYAPWKDLIDYYQKAEDARVKYDQLREYFAPPTLMDRARISGDAPCPNIATAPLIASNVVAEADEGVRAIDGANLILQLPIHAAVIGGSSASRDELARLLARQVLPRAGQIKIGDSDITSLPDSVIGRRIGFVGPETYLGSGSMFDALIYPLLHRPGAPTSAIGKFKELELREAARTGNSELDLDADWIDYENAGCSSKSQLRLRIVEILRVVSLEEEVYEAGLRRTINPAVRASLGKKLLDARRLLRERVVQRNLTSAIETFDRALYIENASVAENILFGTPLSGALAIERLGENDYMRRVIAAAGLTEEFLEKGRRLAAVMTDIFRGLEAGHEFFERFSFIRADDLPVFEAILRRIEGGGLQQLAPGERSRLMELPFKLIASQHTVGLIDQAFKEKILAAREIFAKELPAELKSAVQFFDIDTYNAATTVIDNVLFGKGALSKASMTGALQEIVTEVVTELGLYVSIVELGLETDIGIGGAKLSASQRQRMAIARCLIKRPELLILCDALSLLDPAMQDRVFAAIRADMADRSLILLEAGGTRAASLPRVFMIEDGKVIEQTAGAAAAPRAAATADADEGHVGLGELVGIMAQIPLFAGIDRSKLKLLAFTSERVTYDQGQYVFRQGAPGDKAYVILDGKADVVLDTGAGETVVAHLNRHQVFGEMALLSSMPRTTSIRAAAPLTMLALSQDVFIRLVEENSNIAMGMTRILADRLAGTLRDLSRVSAQVSAGTRPQNRPASRDPRGRAGVT
ncbi:MAG: cyclic nucleotide-binding domain-containing protein [Alphaproteobacteria bacterium]|nr:cyclic nucleotide-binding domain-containing protein [Alphaproteobacteria bacterium]